MPKPSKKRALSSNRMDSTDDLRDEVDDFIEGTSRNGSSTPNAMEKTTSIMDLDMSEEDSGDDMAEYEDYEDEQDESDEESGEDKAEQEFDDKNWGKRKSSYYKRTDESGDEFSSEDEDLAEEAEARRLQKRKAAERHEEDFDDSMAARRSAPKPDVGKTGKITSTDAGLLETMYKDMSFSGVDGMMTSDGRDLSALSKQEKLDLITKDSPELLLLLDSFNAKIKEIRDRLAPLIQRARDQQIPTSKGLSYLETKYHLLLNYCTNVCFYLLLKAEGKSVKNHPVIEHLARTRTVIDRLKPLDQKLKYQIDKLLKLAAQGEANMQSDPKLRYRANVRGFIPMEQDVDDVGDGESADDGYMDVDGSDTEQLNGKSSGDKYVVPKFAPTGDREEKRKIREERRAKKSAMAQYLLEEYGDRPLEYGQLGAGPRSKDAQEAQRERERYEEDNFVRLGLTKKEKKAKKSTSVFVDEFADLADYGDLEALDRADVLHKADDLEERAFSGKRKKRSTDLDEFTAPTSSSTSRLTSIMDSIDKRAEASAAAKGPRYGVDEDIDYDSIQADKKAKRKKLRDERDQAELQHMIDSEKRAKEKMAEAEEETRGARDRKSKSSAPAVFDEDDDFYKETIAAKVQEKAERKAAARAERSERKQAREEAEAAGMNLDDSSPGDGKRKASKVIEQNRGLRKTKKKELHNSRVKIKNRYEKAVQKLRSRGPSEASAAAHYSGTSSGINKRVVKSTSLT